MKILITGCNGRIGKYLVNILKKNHYVRGIDKHHEKNNLFDDFFESNLQNIKIINQSLDDIDIVIHLASLMSWHPDDNKKLFNTNVQGTFNLLSTIGNHSIKKLIFASSGEVYPETNINTKYSNTVKFLYLIKGLGVLRVNFPNRLPCPPQTMIA